MADDLRRFLAGHNFNQQFRRVDKDAGSSVHTSIVDRPEILKVFISHSSHDRNFVEQEIIPLLTSQGFEVFYSSDSIVPADQWERTILKGLKDCDTFLLVMSPRSAQSPWVKREVDWIFHKGGKRVIPVLLEQCDADDFHIGMVSIQHVDFAMDQNDGRQKLMRLLGQLRDSTVTSSQEAALVEVMPLAKAFHEQSDLPETPPVESVPPQAINLKSSDERTCSTAVPDTIDVITSSTDVECIPASGFMMGLSDSGKLELDSETSTKVISPTLQLTHQHLPTTLDRDRLPPYSQRPVHKSKWATLYAFCIVLVWGFSFVVFEFGFLTWRYRYGPSPGQDIHYQNTSYWVAVVMATFFLTIGTLIAFSLTKQQSTAVTRLASGFCGVIIVMQLGIHATMVISEPSILWPSLFEATFIAMCYAHTRHVT